MVKLLGDSSYGLVEEGVVEQAKEGLAKLSYGLAKVNLYGLTKVADSGFEDVKLGESYRAVRSGGSQTRRKAPRRKAPPRKKAPPKRTPARKPSNVHLSKRTPYPPSTVPAKKRPSSPLQDPTNRGVVKTSQPEIAKPRTRVREGQTVKTKAEFKKKSYPSQRKPVSKKTFLPPSLWMRNLLKIFET